MIIPITQKQIKVGDRVLLRASLNVPLDETGITSTFRLEKSLKTIEYLCQKGARVTVIGHLGQNKESLIKVHKELNKHFPVSFIPKTTGEEVFNARKQIQNGSALLLENTRKDDREIQNDYVFATELAAGADFFVYDDFSAAHREHASTVGIIKLLPSYAGLNFYEEITAIKRITERSIAPKIAILGGSKTKTKLAVINEFLENYDHIFLGGVLANSVLKQKGVNIGASKFDDQPLSTNILNSKKIILPTDVVVTKDYIKSETKHITDVENDEIIVDVGETTLKAFSKILQGAKTIVWNGPLGFYEKGFSNQSTALSVFVEQSKAYSLLSGGDTVSLIEKKERIRDWSFVSTGGGSLLIYLATHTLPVIFEFNKSASLQDEIIDNF